MIAPLHDCPGGCGRHLHRLQFACGPCWRRLPRPYRRSIIAAGKRIGPAKHVAAMGAAREWFRREQLSEVA